MDVPGNFPLNKLITDVRLPGMPHNDLYRCLCLPEKFFRLVENGNDINCHPDESKTDD